MAPVKRTADYDPEETFVVSMAQQRDLE